MAITDKERAQLEELATTNKAVDKLLKEYILFSETDISKKFRYKLVAALDAICDDLDNIRDSNFDEVKILNSEDKIFEKLWKMFESGEKIIPIIEYGKGDYKPRPKKGAKNEEISSQVAI